MCYFFSAGSGTQKTFFLVRCCFCAKQQFLNSNFQAARGEEAIKERESYSIFQSYFYYCRRAWRCRCSGGHRTGPQPRQSTALSAGGIYQYNIYVSRYLLTCRLSLTVTVTGTTILSANMSMFCFVSSIHCIMYCIVFSSAMDICQYPHYNKETIISVQ